MRLVPVLIAAILVVTAAAVSGKGTVFEGVVTDTMCNVNHKAMKVAPDAKCVKECVADGRTFKYALADGTHLYKLSDQETPARFSGKKVRVTGTLYTKTNIIKVDTIEAVD